MGKPETLWTVKQVAEYLGVTQRTVYALLRRRKLPALKVGGGWRFKPRELQEWLERQRVGPS